MKRKRIMKKIYMKPATQVVKVEQQLLSGASKTLGVNPDASKAVSDPDAVLGRSGGGWDDED